MKAAKPGKPNAGLFGLAIRNLARHKVKTSITITAVALGILFYLFMDAFMLGVNTESRRNLVNYEMGAATIYSKAYWEKKDEFPLYDGFSGYRPIIDRLEMEGYDGAPRAVFAGSLISKEDELPFVFIGCDPRAESLLFRYHRFIEKENGGHFISRGAFEIVLGVRGAKDLGVSVSDTVRMVTVIDKRDQNGEIRHINQAIDFIVCGIINSPDPVVNGYIAYMPLDILQDEMGLLLEGSITEIVVRTHGAREDELPGRSESPSTIAAKLKDVLPDALTVKGWEENAKDYLNASAGDSVSTVVFLGIFFIVILMVISNTVLMSVLERTREIGMLRALGMPDASIVRLFFIETALIGFLGAAIGVALSLPLNFFMVNYGIDYSTMMKDTGITNLGYRVVGVFKAAWNVQTMIGCLIFTTILSSVTALFPSRRAVKMTITDALRME